MPGRPLSIRPAIFSPPFSRRAAVPVVCSQCGTAGAGSGTGWPGFSEPALAQSAELRRDGGMFARRTAVTCRRCGSHLGLVFGDGPTASGDRYCINSCALAFEPALPDGGSACPA